MTTVVVFGGGGFLGRRLVHRLTAEGMTVRVAVRHPDPARVELRALRFDGITVVPADVRDQASVAAAIAGTDAVVNTVSAYFEKSDVTFEAVHVQGAETVAREAVAAGIARFVLVSGIGADPDSTSPYIRARGRGELTVQQAFPEATIVRPGAMFGPGDALFGTIAELARLRRYCRSSAEVAPDYSQSSGKTWQRLSPAYLPTLEPSAESTSSLVQGYTRCASWSR